jgi:hypothetical protein
MLLGDAIPAHAVISRPRRWATGRGGAGGVGRSAERGWALMKGGVFVTLTVVRLSRTARMLRSFSAFQPACDDMHPCARVPPPLARPVPKQKRPNPHRAPPTPPRATNTVVAQLHHTPATTVLVLLCAAALWSHHKLAGLLVGPGHRCHRRLVIGHRGCEQACALLPLPGQGRLPLFGRPQTVGRCGGRCSLNLRHCSTVIATGVGGVGGGGGCTDASLRSHCRRASSRAADSALTCAVRISVKVCVCELADRVSACSTSSCSLAT